MKRAVSSMDASAQAAQRGSTSTQHYRLKRCKSAFANLKRLGGAGPTNALATARTAASSYADEAPGGGGGGGGAEELAYLPRWRHYASSPEVAGSSSPPFLGSRWPAETATTSAAAAAGVAVAAAAAAAVAAASASWLGHWVENIIMSRPVEERDHRVGPRVREGDAP